VSLLPPSSRSGYVEVAGARLYLQQWGAGTPLVCLHGLGGGYHFFGAVGPALADCSHIVAIDLPGSGLSLSIDAFSFDRSAEVLIDLIRVQGWNRVTVLGHSLATIIALEIYRRAPDLVAGLILVGGLPEPLPASRARIRDRIEQIHRAGMSGMGEQVAAANFSRRTLVERPELTALFGRLFEMQSADGYLATAEALTQWSARPLPPLEQARCLVITGDEDRYAPADAVRAFAKSLPAGTRVEVMPDCGHLPFLEQPREFAAHVRRFLVHEP
jgi:3-oxoadipate enol-lactonase